MRNNNDPERAEAQGEMREAHEALERGDLNAAQRHLDLAIQHRAPHTQTSHLSVQIQTARQEQQKRAKDSGWRGFWAAVICYLLVAIKQPLGWGMPLWIFLAFLLVPGIVGLIVGRQQRFMGSPGLSFKSAFKSTGWAAALYTIVNLLHLGGLHSDPADKWQERLAGMLATLLYGAIAGLVAGAVSATMVRMRVKEQAV